MTFKVISCLTCGRVSGVDVFTTHLTRGLRRMGIDASILLTETDEKVPDPMPLPGDIPIHRLPVTPNDSGRRRRRTLFSYLEDQAPCIYIPNYDYRHSIVSARVSDRVKIVGIVHSDDPMHYDHVYRLGKYWNAIVAVSDKIAQHSAAMEKSFADRVFTIRYGITPPATIRSRARTTGDTLRILYAGRLEHSQKRVLDLVRVLDRLTEIGVPATLTMVGSGEARADIENLGHRHLQAGRLVLTGTIPNHRMGEMYDAADVFLLTSAYEGLPLGLLEAMSHGCVPVVSAIESGIPELVQDGVNGFTAPVGDIDGFARKLTLLHRDAELAHRMAFAARQSIELGEFSADRMCEEYAKVFERIHQHSEAGLYRRPRAFVGEPLVRRTYLRAERNMKRVVSCLRGETPIRPLLYKVLTRGKRGNLAASGQIPAYPTVPSTSSTATPWLSLSTGQSSRTTILNATDP
jgi:glycosyltransferase involved in cell wall biosynthesis